MEDKLYLILGQLQAEVSNVKEGVTRTDRRLVNSMSELRTLIESRIKTLEDQVDDHESRILKQETNWKWIGTIAAGVSAVVAFLLNFIHH